MKKTIWTCAYKLKKNADEREFLAVSKVLGQEYISKQKGYIGWKQLKDGDTCVDQITWAGAEDAKNFEKGGGEENPLALKFYSFIDLMSCKIRCYTVEQDH